MYIILRSCIMKISMLKYTTLFLLMLGHLMSFAQNIGDTLSLSGDLIHRGAELHDEEKYDEAIKLYRMVDKSDTNYTLSRYEEALSLSSLKKYSEARAVCKELLRKKDANRLSTLLLLANCYHNETIKDSALLYLKQASQEFPYSAKVNREFFLTLAKMGLHNEARTQLELAIQQNPLAIQVHLKIADYAYSSNEPVLALMAMHFSTLLNSSPKFQYQAYQIMQQMSEDSYEAEFKAPEKALGDLPELYDVNQLIKAKVPLSAKYKLKTRLDEKYIRQLQFALENIKEIPDQKRNWIAHFYLSFYSEVWKRDLFEACIMTGLSGLKEVDAVAKAYKKSASDISAFIKWATDYVVEVRKNKTVSINGNDLNKSYYYHSNGEVSAIGLEDDKGNNIGEWKYYGENGYFEGSGNYNSNNKRTGEWNFFRKDGKLAKQMIYAPEENTVNYKEYWFNGNLQEEGKLVNDVLEGEYKEYHANGAIKLQAPIKNGKVNGLLKAYRDNGTLEYEKEGINGEFNGVYREYHSNGTIKLETQLKSNNFEGKLVYFNEQGKKYEEAEFSNDLRNGETIVYFDNGQISSKGKYKNGKKDGVFLTYYRNGKLRQEDSYKNGKEDGPSLWYDYDGKLYASLNFKNERLASYRFLDKYGKVIHAAEESGNSIEWKRFTPYGQLLETGTYQKGYFEGGFKKFHPNGKVKSELNYTEGEPNGLIYHYYPNGEKEHELKTLMGNRSGYCRSYHPSGKLSLEGHYIDNDQAGRWNYYYKNGQITTTKFFINDNPYQWEEERFPNGKPDLSNSYFNDVRTNTIYFDPAGKAGDTLNLIGAELKVVASPNGFSQIQGTLKNGSRTGTWEYRYNPEVVSKLLPYKNGDYHGLLKRFYTNGKTQEITKYVDGKRDSIRTIYNQLGLLDKRSSYVQGELEGDENEYYLNGKLMLTNKYEEDEWRSSQLFSTDGSLVYSRIIYNDQIVGYVVPSSNGKMDTTWIQNGTADVIIKYPNGQTALKYSLVNGWYEGEYKFYYADGKLAEESNFLNNEIHGKEVVYHLNGKVFRERNFKEGELHGNLKVYSESGILLLEEQYEEDYLNGPSTVYDNTGKVKRKTNYYYGYAQ